MSCSLLCEYDIDELRRQGFSRAQQCVYLDWAGAALHHEQVLLSQTALLNSLVLANPHSQTSLSARHVQQCRRRILSFFGVSNNTHEVVFSSNATAGLKLIAETFCWQPGSSLCYSRNCHTSVVGMRGLAPNFYCVDVQEGPTFAVDSDQPSLFVFAAQGNFDGVKSSPQLIDEAHSKGWFVCVDAASIVSTSSFSLAEWNADFVSLSFYKMFGLPDGVGALIVKKDSSHILCNKRYFGGGTVESVLVDEDFAKFRKSLSGRLEDGTLPFASIACLKFGFDLFDSLGIQNIQRYTFRLAEGLVSKLSELIHPRSGGKLCVFYGNWDSQGEECTIANQGPIVALNFLRADGTFYGYSEVAKLAGLHNIMIRTGCFCAAGSCNDHLGIDNETTKKHFSEGHVCWDDNDIIEGNPTGAIRVSLGYASTLNDVQSFVDFATECFVEKVEADPPAETATQTRTSLKTIMVFPVKSCAGIDVDTWEVCSSGLVLDREWVIVDENGSHLSQKKIPKLALIQPEVDLKLRVLRLAFSGMSALEIPLDVFPSEQLSELTVCGDRAGGLAYGTEVNTWIAEAIGRPCVLLRAPPQKKRAGTQRWKKDATVTPRQRQVLETVKISYSNEAQFLVMSQATLDDVAGRLKEPLSNFDHRRFRPNFVLEGCFPYQEDNTQSMIINSVATLVRVGPCARCQMICVDPETAVVSKEPLKCLSSYRRKSGKIMLGTLYALEYSGTPAFVSVGDSIILKLK